MVCAETQRPQIRGLSGLGSEMTQFKPGQSGNPGGRPKVLADVQAAAREKTVEAIEVLASIASDPAAPPAARVSAANALLDRAWGKPSQNLQVESKMTLEQLVASSMPDYTPLGSN